MRSTALFALFLTGCDLEAPGIEPAETTPYDAVTCAGGRIDPVPGYPAFKLLEVELPDGDVDAANWVWSPSAAVRVNVDLASFAPTGFDDDAIIDAIGRASHFWNAAAAGFNVLIGDTELVCCADGEAGDCTACDAPGDGAYLYLAEESALSVPASTRTRYGDNPATTPIEPGCLVGTEVRFFTAGEAADGTPVAYRWVPDGEAVEDVDPSDGTVDKPFYDTLVHELGHVLGLGDQDDPTVACSVMGHYADPACDADFELAGPIDEAALRHVYRKRR